MKEKTLHNIQEYRSNYEICFAVTETCRQ